jgi:mono/diheme cytochrome c family protein
MPQARRLAMKKSMMVLIGMGMVLFTVPAVSQTDGGSDYRAQCAGCHGANGTLLPKMARLQNVDPKKLALTASELKREEMIAITEKGREKMPAFEKELTKEQIVAIVDYVLSLPRK